MTLSNLQALRERIAAAKVNHGQARIVGVPVRLGGIHEWFGDIPPLCILADAARSLLRQGTIAGVFWIGRRCWPYPALLNDELLRHSVLLDPTDDAARLWAVDVALRCESPVAVIADAERLSLSNSRRLQLAAVAGGGLALLARPSWELDQLSAACTRWSVRPEPSRGRPRWTVALLRNKDRPVLMDEPPSWTVEWNDAQDLVHLPAVLDGAAARTAAFAS